MSQLIYIACAEADSATSRVVLKALEGAGKQCKILPSKLITKDKPDAEVADAIAASDLMVFILSAHSTDSTELRQALVYTKRHQIRLLTIRIDNTETSAAMKPLLVSAFWFDARPSPEGLNQKKLVETANSLLAKPNPVSSQAESDPKNDSEPQGEVSSYRGGLFKEIFSGDGGLGNLGGLLGGLFGGRSRARDDNIDNDIEETHENWQPSPTRSIPDEIGEPQSERRLQADIYLADDFESIEPVPMSSAFIAGRQHHLNLSIGRGASVALDTGFNEPEFSDDSDVEKLEIRLIHQLKVSSGTIELPKNTRLNSTVWQASLLVPADAGEIEAMVVVLHKNRILQTAKLTGTVVATTSDIDAKKGKIELTLPASVHDSNNLERRDAFDASVVTDGNTSAAFAGASVGVSDLKGVRKIIENMNDKLFKASEAVTMAGTGGDPLPYEQLLVFLAVNGKVLHSVLIQQLMPELDSAKRIQIVSTNPSDMLPLEFVFSGPSPEENATLCGTWRQALETGVCTSCTNLSFEERSATLCPLHFWALSKIIERHAPSKKPIDGHDFLVNTRVIGQREHLEPLRNAVFAASDNVAEHMVEQTMTILSSLIPNCDETRTWKSWASQIENTSPSLLVSMPHNALHPIFNVATLEIGNGDDLRAGEVSRKYICNEQTKVGPIVLLLGCQTAVGGPHLFHTFVGEFRQHGAAVVIGTLATVLGEHAAPITQAIVQELSKPAKSGENTIGDILLRIRRKMFAEGILIALAVASFGDADWVLTAPES